jgi:glycosyltransferase involved in cell wall biosynthesis
MTTPVSVLLPTLNERAFIHDCLESLARQDHPPVEILVLDGGSTDGTREIAAGWGEPVRVVDNPRVTAAAALNVGLGEAKGDVIVRADAHSLYAPDYVGRCVAVLAESGATNVGGPMRPVGLTRFAQAVAAVTSSPFGVGPGRFHYAERQEDVDTVYLGCWRTETLERLGGWDETELQWGAEDHELNFRITSAGGRIVVDPSIRSWYFARDAPRALWRQYFNYGLGKASTLTKHRRLPSWRPLAPAALVLATAAAAGWRRRGVLLPVVVHAGACMAVTGRIARAGDPGRTFVALEICHWSYGLGFWAGVVRAGWRRPFDAAPRGHR